MIPPLNSAGCLPPGVHKATLDEVEKRFGELSEIRRVQMESIRWMVECAVRTGVKRIVLNGSFVSDIIEPNDVDCVLLISKGFPEDEGAEKELRQGFPFLEMALVGEPDFSDLVDFTFASDRYGIPKGMIEVEP